MRQGCHAWGHLRRRCPLLMGLRCPPPNECRSGGGEWFLPICAELSRAVLAVPPKASMPPSTGLLLCLPSAVPSAGGWAGGAPCAESPCAAAPASVGASSAPTSQMFRVWQPRPAASDPTWGFACTFWHEGVVRTVRDTVYSRVAASQPSSQHCSAALSLHPRACYGTLFWSPVTHHSSPIAHRHRHHRRHRRRHRTAVVAPPT